MFVVFVMSCVGVRSVVFACVFAFVLVVCVCCLVVRLFLVVVVVVLLCVVVNHLLVCVCGVLLCVVWLFDVVGVVLCFLLFSSCVYVFVRVVCFRLLFGWLIVVVVVGFRFLM